MTALRLALVLLLLLGGPLAAQDAAPPPAALAPAGPAVIVRQSLDPPSGAVIGQHVALWVDVLFRGEMPRPPRVSLPDVPGLQVLRFESQATTMRDQIDGETYVGQRFEFALYARRGGTFTIPPAEVTLLDRAGEASGKASGEAVRMAVDVPAGVDPSLPVVATRRMTLSEQWEPDPNGPFKAGDALVRTIVRTAEDVPGLAMRDLAFPAPDGVRAYVDPPDISDRSNRGVVTGQRTDRVTYLFERGGRFELPAADQPWWDLGSGTLHTERAVGAAITVAAAPAPNAAGAGGATRPRTWILVGAAGLSALALAVLVLIRRRLAHAGGTDAEPRAFARLRAACAGADGAAAYRAFAGWRRFLDPARDAAAAAALAPLDDALFSGRPRGWATEQARHLLENARRLRRPRPALSQEGSLPPLNP